MSDPIQTGSSPGRRMQLHHLWPPSTRPGPGTAEVPRNSLCQRINAVPEVVSFFKLNFPDSSLFITEHDFKVSTAPPASQQAPSGPRALNLSFWELKTTCLLWSSRCECASLGNTEMRQTWSLPSKGSQLCGGDTCVNNICKHCYKCHERSLHRIQQEHKRRSNKS